MSRKKCAWVCAFAGLPLLAGCAAMPTTPAATADSVLAAQYRASGSHGAMTGEEAARVMQRYEQAAPWGASPPQPGAPAANAPADGSTH
jgi:hypothetical protein